MKNNQAFLLFLTGLLIISSACRSQTQSTQTETPPVPDTPTIAASPTAASVPSGPLSLVQLYDARVRSGEWTEGEGLVNLLGMYTGSSPSQNVLGAYTVNDSEVTGLLRIADRYLTQQTNDRMHDNVQQQVNQLVAPLDRLEHFSRQHNLSVQTLQLVSWRLSPPLDTGDQETCQQLWREGFSSTSDVICFEYDDRTVNGTNLRLYYPSWWSADDSRRARLQPFVDAASLAIRTFNAYGPDPLPPVTLVVTELAGTNPRTGASDSDLRALARRAPSSQCYVGLFPSLFSITVEQSQQSLAHEMFHCYQYQNLSAQESGPAADANEWWVEGSAEYFSNVVYPSVNYEHRWLSQLVTAMQDETLFGWSYKSFIFFQYLENRSDVGTDGILNLLRSMPTSGGVDQQNAALSHYPNMDVIFHEFAQTIADKKIVDSDHSLIALPVPLAVDIVEATPTGDILGRSPFAVDIHRVIFPRDLDFDLSFSIRGNSGRSSARLENAVGEWGALPSSVFAGCSDINYFVVVTQTDSDPSNNYQFTLRATSHPSQHVACSCINGTWLLDDASYLTHLNGIIEQSAPGSLTYTSVTGSDTVTFSPDGHMTQTVDQMLINADSSIAGMSIQVAMDGTSNASYTSTEGRLSFTDYEANLTVTTLLNNQPVSAPTSELASGPLGTGATYVCADNTLTLTPIYPTYSDLPALTFTRQSP
jgi:hypothetical protein